MDPLWSEFSEWKCYGDTRRSFYRTAPCVRCTERRTDDVCVDGLPQSNHTTCMLINMRNSEQMQNSRSTTTTCPSPIPCVDLSAHQHLDRHDQVKKVLYVCVPLLVVFAAFIVGYNFYPSLFRFSDFQIFRIVLHFKMRRRITHSFTASTSSKDFSKVNGREQHEK